METTLAPDLIALISRFEFPRRAPALERGELALFNRDVFGRMLDKFVRRLGSFKAASDVEAIHDMRVLARRLSEYLQVLEPASPPALLLPAQDFLQQFMRALGPIRNSDVSRGTNRPGNASPSWSSSAALWRAPRTSSANCSRAR